MVSHIGIPPDLSFKAAYSPGSAENPLKLGASREKYKNIRAGDKY
jgi:hypothetical protein